MMRIALINGNAVEREGLRKALLRCLGEARRTRVDIACFDGMAAFHDMLVTRNPRHFEVVFCCTDRLRGLETASAEGETTSVGPLALLARLQERNRRLHVVVASHSTTPAALAYQMGAQFLHLPGTFDDLRRVMREPLSRVGWDTRPCLAIRTSGQVTNVSVADIQFIESSKRGPVIHLPEGATAITRGTLKGLFERLEDACTDAEDPAGQRPFVMAGSSFVVNLENIVASGKGVLVFDDGETIIVPVRKRKDIERALRDFRSFGPDIV